MKKFFAASAALLLSATLAFAQNQGTVTNNAFAVGQGPTKQGFQSVLCTAGQLPTGQAAAPICRSMSGDATYNSSGTLTLATVNGSPGSFGSATQCIALTTNAKGLITAISQAVCTPAITSVTGLGANCAAWLGTPSSANLRACITDESGTGLVYFQGGDLGTPSAGVLTNATGLPISTGVSGLGTGCATFLGTPSSANLRGCVNDETGAGLAYFQGGDIGTPSAGVGTNLTALNASNLSSGTLPAARTNGHLNGEPTNGNANAGEIGEYVESVIPAGSSVALTTGVAANVTSISVTAGDWTVCGAVTMNPAATTSFTTYGGSVGTVSATFDVTYFTFERINATVPANPLGGFTTCRRALLSSTTTYFLVALANFTVSTTGAYGWIWARRER